jgi:hypothetical protein
MALMDLPAPLDKPPEEASAAELFADNFRESLLFNREVLKWPIVWNDPEILKTKREVALATQTAAVRIQGGGVGSAGGRHCC